MPNVRRGSVGVEAQEDDVVVGTDAELPATMTFPSGRARTVTGVSFWPYGRDRWRGSAGSKGSHRGVAVNDGVPRALGPVAGAHRDHVAVGVERIALTAS